MKLGQLIADYRWINRKTGATLASEIGIPVHVIYRLEKGHGCTGDELILILAWLFGPGQHRNEDNGGDDSNA